MNEHAKSIPDDSQTNQTTSITEIELGSIVSLTSHPYLPHDIMFNIDGESRQKDQGSFVKIGAYNRSTPPLMVVIEVRKGNKYDKVTRKKTTSFKCIYYSTTEGKFEEHWFKENEVKLIESKQKSLHDENKNYDLTKLREVLIGQQAILTSVDMELGKVKLYKDSDPGKLKYRESNLLDFLPPLGTITNISTIDSHVQYDEFTGQKVFEKCRIKAKIKWYNNESRRFSEEEIPLNALMKVSVSPDANIFEFEKVYYIKKDIPLEENKEIRVTKIPVKIHDMVFKHYYYQYRVKSLFNNNLIVLEKEEIPKVLNISDDFDFEENGRLDLNVAEHRRMEFEKNPDTWYRIFYRDVSDNYTTRIIRTVGIYDFEIGDVHALLKANCLLRDGNIRHFRMDRILGYEKLDWFEGEFI